MQASRGRAPLPDVSDELEGGAQVPKPKVEEKVDEEMQNDFEKEEPEPEQK